MTATDSFRERSRASAALDSLTATAKSGTLTVLRASVNTATIAIATTAQNKIAIRLLVGIFIILLSPTQDDLDRQ
jgi:hypothetical protein